MRHPSTPTPTTARAQRALPPLPPRRRRTVTAAPRAVADPPTLPFTREARHLDSWAADSWRSKKAYQQPNYPDAAAVKEATAEIARMPPLVFAGECRTLQERLAACATGEAFMLQSECWREGRIGAPTARKKTHETATLWPAPPELWEAGVSSDSC